MVLIVALTGIDLDKILLDASLDATGHVVVDGGEPTGHADGFVVTVLGAVRALQLRIVEVDGVDEESSARRVVSEDAAEAVLAKRTDGAVAYIVMVGLLSEYLLSGLWGIVLVCHIVLLFACKDNDNILNMQTFL